MIISCAAGPNESKTEKINGTKSKLETHNASCSGLHIQLLLHIISTCNGFTLVQCFSYWQGKILQLPYMPRPDFLNPFFKIIYKSTLDMSDVVVECRVGLRFLHHTLECMAQIALQVIRCTKLPRPRYVNPMHAIKLRNESII